MVRASLSAHAQREQERLENARLARLRDVKAVVKSKPLNNPARPSSRPSILAGRASKPPRTGSANSRPSSASANRRYNADSGDLSDDDPFSASIMLSPSRRFEAMRSEMNLTPERARRVAEELKGWYFGEQRASFDFDRIVEQKSRRAKSPGQYCSQSQLRRPSKTGVKTSKPPIRATSSPFKGIVPANNMRYPSSRRHSCVEDTQNRAPREELRQRRRSCVEATNNSLRAAGLDRRDNDGNAAMEACEKMIQHDVDYGCQLEDRVPTKSSVLDEPVTTPKKCGATSSTDELSSLSSPWTPSPDKSDLKGDLTSADIKAITASPSPAAPSPSAPSAPSAPVNDRGTPVRGSSPKTGVSAAGEATKSLSQSPAVGSTASPAPVSKPSATPSSAEPALAAGNDLGLRPASELASPAQVCTESGAANVTPSNVASTPEGTSLTPSKTSSVPGKTPEPVSAPSTAVPSYNDLVKPTDTRTAPMNTTPPGNKDVDPLCSLSSDKKAKPSDSTLFSLAPDKAKPVDSLCSLASDAKTKAKPSDSTLFSLAPEKAKPVDPLCSLASDEKTKGKPSDSSLFSLAPEKAKPVDPLCSLASDDKTKPSDPLLSLAPDPVKPADDAVKPSVDPAKPSEGAPRDFNSWMENAEDRLAALSDESPVSRRGSPSKSRRGSPSKSPKRGLRSQLVTRDDLDGDSGSDAYSDDFEMASLNNTLGKSTKGLQEMLAAAKESQ